MRVLVTGCLGNVGRIACEGFQNAGFEVVGLDIGDGCAAPSVEFHRGSVRDYDTLLRVMAGCDTVLHLAAYNHPFSAPEQEMFELNVAGTFHVFKACQALGIRQLTVASSPNAIGYNFGVRPADLSSVPIGGDHPLYTTDMYSFTKENIELIGRYFYRRYGISSIFMRFGLDFTNTIEQWMAETGGPADVRKLHRWVKELMALPGREAAQEVRRIENALNARRLASFESKVPYRNGTEYVYAYFSEEQRI